MGMLLIALPGNEPLGRSLSANLNLPLSSISVRHFPDGETLVRMEDDCKGRGVLIVASLHHPDEKFLPLAFLSETLRDAGASRIGLLTPYLPYMRQDCRFREGEGVTSRYFAKLMSAQFNWLMTIDPHLHRYRSLGEIYTIPQRTLSAAPLVSEWIRGHVQRPLLIGPDRESEQWVSQVAQGAQAPFVVLTKVRHGDRDVDVSLPQIERWKDHTPVLVDDIISTGRTMIETIGHLKTLQLAAPVCIGIHALFSDEDYRALLHAGAAQVVTTNTVPHVSNGIDVSGLLSQQLKIALAEKNFSL